MPSQSSGADIECALRQLMYRETVLHDDHNYGDMIGLYGDDAEYRSPFRGVLRGRQQILDGLAARPKRRLARHLLTNVVVDVHDENHASSRCYVLGVANDEGHPLKQPVPAVGAPVFGEHIYRFQRHSGVWKISFKETVAVFSGQTARF